MTRPTSIVARIAIRPKTMKLRGQVFVFILRRGKHGATLSEIEAGLGMSGNTVRPRRLELEEKDLVVDSGLRRTTPSGKPAIVWIVPEHIAMSARAKLFCILKEPECSSTA